MQKTRSLRASIPALVLSVACSGPAEMPGSDGGRPALSVVPTGFTATSLVDAEAGATITLEAGAHTYVLELTPNALSTDTEITLEEVTIPELPGALAVRFSPDGLVFDVPALLSVDAPYEEPTLALAFRAGEPGVEMVFAAPHLRGMAMQVEHFSEAAFVPSADAGPALDDEQAASAAEIDEVARGQAEGMGVILNGRVATVVDAAAIRIAELEIASIVLAEAAAEIQRRSLEDLPAGRFSALTVGELVAELQARFEAKALQLYRQLSAPTCNPGADVVGVTDWARAIHRLRSTFQTLGLTAPNLALCLSTRLTVSSTPAVLTPTTEEVVLSRVALEVVGPGMEPEFEQLPSALFTFVPTGADGPRDLPSDTGVVTNVRFVRPAGASRPREVTIVINGHTRDIMLGGLPSPPPVTVRVAEPVTFAGSVSVGSGCMSLTGTTSVDCGLGPRTGLEIRDTQSESVSATLRVSVAGAVVSVEATDVVADRITMHEVDEHDMPSVSEALALPSAAASGTVEADGRIKVRICGLATVETRIEMICERTSDVTTAMRDSCWELFLTPTPAAMPTELVPSPIVLGCGDEMPFASGVLVPE